MKKVYVAPRIAVESFKLNQTIATSCGWTSEKFFGHPTHGDPTNCAWVDVAGERYWTNRSICDDEYPLDIEVTEGCYNAPSGTQQVFAS